MDRHLVLHIGVEKTGSKAIQKELRTNAGSLAQQGVLFPKTPGPGNHTHAVAASINDDVHCSIKSNILANKSLTLEELRQRLAISIDREVSEAANLKAIIVSSELIHSRLRSHEEIERLLGFFKNHVDRISVVVFLRRQDRLAVSNFSASLRAGFSNFDGVFADRAANRISVVGQEPNPNDFHDFYDYERLLSRFTPFVEPQNIHPFIYEDEAASGFPLAARVAEIAGVKADTLKIDDARVNESLTDQQQFLFSKVNAVLPLTDPTGRRNKELKTLHKLIEEEVGGQKRQIERAQASAFLDKFKTSNEHVRQHYFPDRENLFDKNFDAYPENVRPFVPSADLLEQLEKYLAKFNDRSISEPATKSIFRKLKNKIRLRLSQGLF